MSLDCHKQTLVSSLSEYFKSKCKGKIEVPFVVLPHILSLFSETDIVPCRKCFHSMFIQNCLWIESYFSKFA